MKLNYVVPKNIHTSPTESLLDFFFGGGEVSKA